MCHFNVSKYWTTEAGFWPEVRVAVRALEEIPWALLSSCGSKQCLQTVSLCCGLAFMWSVPSSCGLSLVVGVLQFLSFTVLGFQLPGHPHIWGVSTYYFSLKKNRHLRPLELLRRKEAPGSPCTLHKSLWGHTISAVSTRQQGCPPGIQGGLWQLCKFFLSIFIFNS